MKAHLFSTSWINGIGKGFRLLGFGFGVLGFCEIAAHLVDPGYLGTAASGARG